MCAEGRITGSRWGPVPEEEGEAAARFGAPGGSRRLPLVVVNTASDCQPLPGSAACLWRSLADDCSCPGNLAGCRASGLVAGTGAAEAHVAQAHKLAFPRCGGAVESADRSLSCSAASNPNSIEPRGATRLARARVPLRRQAPSTPAPPRPSRRTLSRSVPSCSAMMPRTSDSTWALSCNREGGLGVGVPPEAGCSMTTPSARPLLTAAACTIMR